jgi:hypothetical protein
VLIGTTTNLGSELNVNNTIRVGVAFGSQASIVFGDSGTPYWSVGRPAGSGNFAISSYALTALTIAPTTGNVGIGTTSPSQTLHVNGTGLFTGSTLSGNVSAGVYILDQNIYSLNGGSARPLSIQAETLTFFTGTTYSEKMRITSSGDVLVGQTSLSLSANGWALQQGGTGHASFQITNNEAFIFNNRTTGTTAQIDFRTNGLERGAINITDSGVSYTSASDYRIKEDLQPINGLEKVNAIKVYNFKFKETGTRTDGVLAHELQEVLPYAEQGEKDGKKLQGVDYSKIVPVLVKAVQELKSENDNLKSRLEVLEQA